MNMALICMGRLKEKYWRDAANEYEKRLSRFGKFEEIELPDLPEPANSSPAVEAQICEKEGKTILQKVREDDIVIALCIGGRAARFGAAFRKADAAGRHGAAGGLYYRRFAGAVAPGRCAGEFQTVVFLDDLSAPAGARDAA